MKNDFQRVAIVDRGDAAVRFIHAVRDFNAEYGTSMRTIAVFTELERHSTFVREADEAFSLGAAQFRDPGTDQLKNSYLDYGRLEQALTKSRAEAAWVGWGLLAAQPEFAELCHELGIAFIGPEANVMRRLCDRISTKQLATAAGIPIIPWSDGPVETFEDAKFYAERLAYPVVIKSAVGGFSESTHLVRSKSELPELFNKARAEAFEASGNPTIFLEQSLAGTLNLEVDILADAHGSVWAPVVRSRSIRNNSPELIYESPAPVLSAHQDDMVREMATRLARA